MEEKLKPWSGLAIASLACGVLSLVFGILTGIPAVICGHLEMSRIRKSGGELRGQEMALAGSILGIVMTVLWALVPGFFDANRAINRAQLLTTKTDTLALEQAVVNFYQQNSKLPESGAYDFNTGDPAGRRLLNILLGPDGSRHVPLLSLRIGKHRKKGGLIYESGTSGPVVGLFDAWGNPFRVMVDDDEDAVIRFTYGGKSEVVQGRRIVVASKGEDGSEGTADDVKSW